MHWPHAREYLLTPYLFYSARPAWLNNSDFMIRKASAENPDKELIDFLGKSSLEGKQVWYFTAPASLPISIIKDTEIDLAKAQAGGAIINHKGDGYGLDIEPFSASTKIQLMIPSKGGDKYKQRRYTCTVVLDTS